MPATRPKGANLKSFKQLNEQLKVTKGFIEAAMRTMHSHYFGDDVSPVNDRRLIGVLGTLAELVETLDTVRKRPKSER